MHKIPSSALSRIPSEGTETDQQPAPHYLCNGVLCVSVMLLKLDFSSGGAISVSVS